MNVYTVGSIDPALPEDEQVKMREASRAIGEKLAQAGHTIIVGSDHETTVDLYIVQGANNAKRKNGAKVIVFPPEMGERRNPQPGSTPFSSTEKKPHIKLTYERSSGTWHSSQLAATYYADVILAIGGMEGTEITGHYAFFLGKPLLPLPAFGGAAKTLYEKFKFSYLNRLSAAENEHLFYQWADKESPSDTISALKKLFDENPFSRKPRTKSWIKLAVVAVVLLALWGGVFFFWKSLPLPSYASGIAIYLVSIFAALLGTTLRQAALLGPRLRAVVFGRIGARLVEIDAGLFLQDAIVAVLTCFVLLTLFYGATAYLIGDMDVFASDKFGRFAVIATVLGAAVGFRPEIAERVLQRRLASALAEDHLVAADLDVKK